MLSKASITRMEAEERMRMASKKRIFRTQDEVMEIREYRKLVRFAEEVMTGRHSRVKIPAWMFPVTPGGSSSNPIIISSPMRAPSPPPASPKRKHSFHAPPVPSKLPSAHTSVPRPPTAPRAMLPPPLPCIDFSTDYYKILGVEPHVTTDSINRGYASKRALYSPVAATSAWRWSDRDPKVRKKVKENWERVENARRVLTDKELRRKYDIGKEEVGTKKKRGPAQSQKQRQKRGRRESPILEDRAVKRGKIESMPERIVGGTNLVFRKTKVEHVIESLEDLDFGSDSDSIAAVYGD